MPPSSSGLGPRVLSPVTGVRIPLGVLESLGIGRGFFVGCCLILAPNRESLDTLPPLPLRLVLDQHETCKRVQFGRGATVLAAHHDH